MQGVKNLHGSDFVEHKKLSIVHYRKTLANCKFLGVVIKDYNWTGLKTFAFELHSLLRNAILKNT